MSQTTPIRTVSTEQQIEDLGLTIQGAITVAQDGQDVEVTTWESILDRNGTTIQTDSTGLRITPELARELAAHLHNAADHAERARMLAGQTHRI